MKTEKEVAELAKLTIQEMANDVRRIRESYFGKADYLFAKALYEEGYRKTMKGDVILSEFEYKDLKGRLRAVEIINRLWIETSEKKDQFIEEITDKLRESKEATAREVITEILSTLIVNNEENTETFDYYYTIETIKEIAKKYGVEV